MENQINSAIPCRDIVISTTLLTPRQVATAPTGELTKGGSFTFMAIDSKPQGVLKQGETYSIRCILGTVGVPRPIFKAKFNDYEMFGPQTRANFTVLVFINEQEEEIAEPALV